MRDLHHLRAHPLWPAAAKRRLGALGLRLRLRPGSGQLPAKISLHRTAVVIVGRE